MSVWDDYHNRIVSRGVTRRDVALNREKSMLLSKIPNSLSYQSVTIFDQSHGYNIDSPATKLSAVEKSVSIINTDNLNEKYIISMPDDDIGHGDLVCWMDNYWLVTEIDANKTVYTRAKMIQCNHLLKWVSDDDTICEQWCIVEDGTKLKRIRLRNSLVCWKRHAIRIPLIAGNPLEPHYQNGAANSRIRQWFENNGDWAISSQASNRGRFNDYPGRGSRHKRVETGNPNLRIIHLKTVIKPAYYVLYGEDIVCAL